MKRLLTTVVLATVFSSHALSAQTAGRTANAGGAPFFQPRDAAWAAAFAAASAGVSVFDVRIAHWFRDTSLTHVHIGRKVDKAFSKINETTLTLGGIVLYGVGRLSHSEVLSDVSIHTAESVAAASLTAQVIRGPLGRTRPIDANPPFDNQYDFHFLHGFTHFEQRAFPSIHSSSGFAAASAIVAEVQRRDPGAKWLVGIPAYALALTPGVSRLYLGQHWASDIFAGAALGAFYGWRVVDYSHAHPTTRVDRIFLGHTRRDGLAGVMPNGTTIGWSFRF